MDYLAPLGPVYQAGTLSGNPLAMAAGIAQLKELDKNKGWDVLEILGARLEAGIRGLLEKYGKNYQLNRVGSMFCLFFTDQEIINMDSVSGADMETFKKFFWNLLDEGVYFAPSPYETGFISMAHSTGDIDDTLDAMDKAFERTFKG